MRGFEKPIQEQKIDFPQGGGAIKSIGETFEPNGFSGTGNFAIPIAVTPARGLEPQLSLSYNSGVGNGPFGLGFSLNLSKFSIRTEKGLPRYDGVSDVFLFDSEELVSKKSTKRREGDYTVTEYLPRVVSELSSIRHYVSNDNSYWKVTSADNTCMIFGKTHEAQISDCANPSRIFEWLIESVEDSNGNKILYSYAQENDQGIEGKSWEKNRAETNKYIRSIKYGNFLDDNDKEEFAFEVLFNYGQHQLPDQNPECNPYDTTDNWLYRADAFSSYKSTFEVRTRRLCRNILMFHHFKKELGDPCLVKALSFEYEQTKHSKLSIIKSVTATGYTRHGKKHGDSYTALSLPKTDFSYSKFAPPKEPRFNQLLEDQSGIPGYLDASGFQPIDLNCEGIAGLLYQTENGLKYLEAEGDGKYSPPTDVIQFPIDQNFEGAQASLVDLEGRGQLELVVNDGNRTGYYAKRPTGKVTGQPQWSSFVPFETYPTDYADPAMEMVGLANNGMTDLVMFSESENLRYPSRGRKGFEKRLTSQRSTDFPLIKKGDLQEYVGFANILGDGLSHRVKITRNTVEVWPNLGYGQFGEAISLGDTPDFGDDFDASRLQLADTDGSGVVDLIYITPTHVNLYVNQNGNGFSEAISIKLPDHYSNIDRISFADILGNGTSCLVLTTISPKPIHWFYNFVGINTREESCIKPYLLNEIDNNMGGLTQIEYCSSTKFYLEDKKAHRPWMMPLPFPVQVVERVTTIDQITEMKFSTRHAYHEGYYDYVEREFRGFGFVESWDTETYEELQAQDEASSPNQSLRHYLPPVHTKTWHHTGAAPHDVDFMGQYKSQFYQGDKQAYDMPAPVLDADICTTNIETIRQAHAALKGSIIRSEVYMDDAKQNPELAKHPLRVEHSNGKVCLVQEKQEGAPFAIFRLEATESISYHYERNPNDPRVEQQFTLSTDDFGNVLKSCHVSLPRRDDPAQHIYAEQQKTVAVLEENKYVSPVASDAHKSLYYYVKSEQRQFEILGLKQKNYFTYDEIKKAVASLDLNDPNEILTHDQPFVQNKKEVKSRLLEWYRSYFWNPEQSKALPLGQLTEKGLQHHLEAAVFTQDYIDDLLLKRLRKDDLKDKAGYIFDAENGFWWNKGLVQHYRPHNDKNGFFLPFITANVFFDKSSPLYVESTTTYDDYGLCPIAAEQYIDEKHSLKTSVKWDYRVGQPYVMVDANANVSEALFDELGQAYVTSRWGNETDINGKVAETGAMRLYDHGNNKAEYRPQPKPTFDDVLKNPGTYLQGAASYFFYDFAYDKATRQPVATIHLQAKNHWKPTKPKLDHTADCLTTLTYSDGHGQALEVKQKYGPRECFIRDENGKPVQRMVKEAWAVNGRTVYNNKGNPVERYQPYFTNTPTYEDQRDVPVPPPSRTTYDPLGRAIRTNTPKGFFSKVEFTPWLERHYDENDTVLDSKYFIENYASLKGDEKDAIDKAIASHNTPSTQIYDSKGAVFLGIVNNLGNVRPKLFKGLGDKKAIFTTLKDKGYLREKKKSIGGKERTFNWLTDKFRPYTEGFKLEGITEDHHDEIVERLRQNCLTSRQDTDIQGRNILAVDARLYYKNIKNGNTNLFNFKYRYPMNSGKENEDGETSHSPILTDSVDEGTVRHLDNAFGQQLWSWTTREYCQLLSYDRLQRKSKLKIKKMEGTRGPVASYDDFNLVEVFSYGEQKGLSEQELQDRNLNGALYELKDLSGIITNDLCSLNGENIKASRQMASAYKEPADWRKDVALDDEVHTTITTYNALGHPLNQTSPDGSKTNNRYNFTGALIGIDVDFKDEPCQSIIKNIDYNAQGLRSMVRYGNGVEVRYVYEDTTLHLLSMKSDNTNAGASDTPVQDIVYTYDPVGNITRLRDHTHETVFYKNQKVEPLSDYHYDPLNRLIRATGRKHPKLGEHSYENGFKQAVFSQLPHTNDNKALETYTEAYAYDEAGNLLEQRHTASKGWTRKMDVAVNSNRLEKYNYDAHGNLRQIERGSTLKLDYNCCNNLVSATVIERDNAVNDAEYYVYDSDELRTRKVNEKMMVAAVSIEEKIYLGNFEIKRRKKRDAVGETATTLERHTLRVMDGDKCVAIIHRWVKDDKKVETSDLTKRKLRFQMDNHLNSVSLELDEKAQLISYEEYLPYGGTAIIAGKNEKEVKLKDYRYSAKECDNATGLYYYGRRYYAPWQGRWLNPDPAGTVDGLNVFAFVKGNPVGSVDYMGLMENNAFVCFECGYASFDNLGNTINTRNITYLMGLGTIEAFDNTTNSGLISTLAQLVEGIDKKGGGDVLFIDGSHGSKGGLGETSIDATKSFLTQSGCKKAHPRDVTKRDLIKEGYDFAEGDKILIHDLTTEFPSVNIEHLNIADNFKEYADAEFKSPNPKTLTKDQLSEILATGKYNGTNYNYIVLATCFSFDRFNQAVKHSYTEEIKKDVKIKRSEKRERINKIKQHYSLFIQNKRAAIQFTGGAKAHKFSEDRHNKDPASKAVFANKKNGSQFHHGTQFKLTQL
ncbi:SpvB/TcaC N-terminal domain-containing protein [Terasakiella sp. SH-1]|uniref:SpvB/TcaC N-terminal domain-containing protein n=1 Tax=Terasakiella sp. SH-1 TaxID=2560057 RepID=UPI00107450D8|nr:SpvB/TcaC N-terminal domain-containing protein [Terasakiella sp. SH-1]